MCPTNKIRHPICDIQLNGGSAKGRCSQGAEELIDYGQRIVIVETSGEERWKLVS